MILSRALVVAAVAVAVSVASCASPGDPARSGEPGTSPASSVTSAGQDDLRSALLTVDDLPSGFTEAAVPDNGGLGDFKGCPLLDTSSSSDVNAQAALVFTSGATAVSETILQMSEDSARQSMSGLARVPSECHEFTANVSGLDVAFTPDVLDLASMGDETVALRLTAQVAGLPVAIEEHVVAVRHGRTILIVTHAAPGSTDRAVTESITRAAYEKAVRRQ
jgi:hypothetical protein